MYLLSSFLCDYVCGNHQTCHQHIYCSRVFFYLRRSIQHIYIYTCFKIRNICNTCNCIFVSSILKVWLLAKPSYLMVTALEWFLSLRSDFCGAFWTHFLKWEGRHFFIRSAQSFYWPQRDKFQKAIFTEKPQSGSKIVSYSPKSTK